MKKIKLLPIEITSDVEKYLKYSKNVYSFDKIEEPFYIHIDAAVQSLYIGENLFYRGCLKIPVCKKFGGTPGLIFKKDAVDLPTEALDYVFCFEPRVSMHTALSSWITKQGVSLGFINKINMPLPSYEEAVDFLKKNGIYNKNRIYQYHETGAYSTPELKYIPEDIKKRIEYALEHRP